MPFVKLDTNILHSTIWVDLPGRSIFLTALLLASPRELLEPTPQLEVNSLKETGFIIPPGWYGFAPASGPGIVALAGIERDIGLSTLEQLGKPEPESRSQDFDGRRLIRTNGGFIVLNYMKYRDYDYTAAERQKRWRARKSVTRDSNGVTRNTSTKPLHPPQQSRIAEAEADTEAEATTKASIQSSRDLYSYDTSKLTTAASPPPKKGTRVPVDFAVTSEMRSWALAAHLPNPDDHICEFIDYWTAKAGVGAYKLDWPATFRNWLRRAVDYGGKANGNGTQPTRAQQNLKAALDARSAARRAVGVDH